MVATRTWMGPGLKVIARGWRYISVVEHVLCTHEVLISILSAHTHTHTHTHTQKSYGQTRGRNQEREKAKQIYRWYFAWFNGGRQTWEMDFASLSLTFLHNYYFRAINMVKLNDIQYTCYRVDIKVSSPKCGPYTSNISITWEFVGSTQTAWMRICSLA
jgi:hypothetical protein